MKSALFSQIPSTHSLLSAEPFQPLLAKYGHLSVTRIIQQLQQEMRNHIRCHNCLPPQSLDWYHQVNSRLQAANRSRLTPVFNLTGTVLHTNLGRALQAESAIQAVCQAMRYPVTLEYSLSQGERGHRDQIVADLLCKLTGAEDACIVNNNAAAVLLMLAACAQGKEVVVSRGELVEIGGAFRIPDVMRQAGCQLVEVGCTNRTHAKDYLNAISDNTALLMKVHTSNYQISGFSHEVDEAELVALANQASLPVITDLGSGSLVDLTQWGLPAEPMPQRLIAAGVSLVSFSGDKLLGGPQAGIIVGKKHYIEQLQKHPLKRALRADKMTLAALEATLRLYQNPQSLNHSLPTLRLLTRTEQEIRQQAERLYPVFVQRFAADFHVRIQPCLSQIGSGSLPVERLPSCALTLEPKEGQGAMLLSLRDRLRHGERPIIGRIAEGRMWFDLRCLEHENLFLEMIDL